MPPTIWIYDFKAFFHVSDGIDQFKTIFKKIKISNSEVRTVDLFGETPPPVRPMSEVWDFFFLKASLIVLLDGLIHLGLGDCHHIDIR